MSLGCLPNPGNAGSYGGSTCYLLGNHQTVPHGATPFYIPTSPYMRTPVSHHLCQHLIISAFLLEPAHLLRVCVLREATLRQCSGSPQSHWLSILVGRAVSTSWSFCLADGSSVCPRVLFRFSVCVPVGQLHGMTQGLVLSLFS